MRQSNLPIRLALATALASLPALPAFAQASEKTSRSGAAAPARDPDIAVQEEFDTARASGTVEAWELFIARHPEHPLATTARKELRRLTGQ